MNNYYPSLTFRQIYSAENVYVQLFQQVNWSGISGGFLVSKAIPITDNVTFTSSFRSNIMDHNWHNKLKFALNKNISLSFKVVLLGLTKKTVTDLRVFIPNSLSAKLEYKEVNGNYSMGVGVFLKDGVRIGFKPCFTVASIHFSAPVVVAKGSTFAGMPLKLIFGLLSLAGLLFYAISEKEETDDSKEKAFDRYKDACAQWNESRKGETKAQTGRLKVVAAFAWDSTLPAMDKTVDEAVKGALSSGRSLSAAERSAALKEKIEKATPLVYDLTEEVASTIVMDSINLKMDDAGQSFLSSVPRLDASNKIAAVVVYDLDGSLAWSTFKDRILIGRKL